MAADELSANKQVYIVHIATIITGGYVYRPQVETTLPKIINKAMQ